MPITSYDLLVVMQTDVSVLQDPTGGAEEPIPTTPPAKCNRIELNFFSLYEPIN